jgi:hypothetical protein
MLDAGLVGRVEGLRDPLAVAEPECFARLRGIVFFKSHESGGRSVCPKYTAGETLGLKLCERPLGIASP